MSESVRVSMPPIFALGLLSPEERRQREIRALVRDHLKRAAGITDKEFADGYSFAVQEILAAIQGAA